LSSFQTHNAAPSAPASPYGWKVPPERQRPPPYNPFNPALHNINLRIPARPADVAISTIKSKNFPVEATYLQQARQIQAGSSPYQGPRNPVGLPPSATFVPAGGARPVGTFPYLQKPKRSTVSSSKLTKKCIIPWNNENTNIPNNHHYFTKMNIVLQR